MGDPTRYIGLLIGALVLGSVQPTSAQSCTIDFYLLATAGTVSDSASVGIPRDAAVKWAPWGRWVVVEDGNAVIQYDRSGAWAGWLGSRGQGPDEFMSPVAIAVDPTDSVWVSDSRGRVIIVGPDGAPGRTLTNPSIYAVEGFTPDGNPFGVLTRVARSEGELDARRMIQVWDRDGQPLNAFGPGARIEGTTVNEASYVDAVIDQTGVAIVPFGSESGWLSRWTSDGEDVLLPLSDVSALVARGEEPMWQATGVVADSVGYWVAGGIRVLSEAQEEALLEDAPRVPGESAVSFVRSSPWLRNQVYDGMLLRVDPTGDILGSVRFDHFPFGFADDATVYTYEQSDFGLITLEFWTFNPSCG